MGVTDTKGGGEATYTVDLGKETRLSKETFTIIEEKKFVCIASTVVLSKDNMVHTSLFL